MKLVFLAESRQAGQTVAEGIWETLRRKRWSLIALPFSTCPYTLPHMVP